MTRITEKEKGHIKIRNTYVINWF